MRTSLSFFGGLYFLQGAALAYVVNFQKPFLAARGIPKETIGVFTGLLLIPFVAKVGLGALSDRRGGRRAYMILGLTLFAGGYAALAQIDPAVHFGWFAATSWIASLGLAWFDTCADGWAVDVADADQQGAVQAAMIAGKAIGLIVSAWTFGMFGDEIGYPNLFRGLAGLAVVGASVVAVMPYRPKRIHARGGAAVDPASAINATSAWARVRSLIRAAGRSGAGRLALFGILYSIASFGTDGLVTLHLMETRLANLDVIGQFGAARGLGALLGAWAFVKLTAAMGEFRLRYLALFALGCGCLLPLLELNVVSAGLAWGLCWGLQETAFVTLAMRFARGAWSATVFAALMICSNVGTAIGEFAAAPLVPRIGYGGVFVTFAALAWASAAVVPRNRSDELKT